MEPARYFGPLEPGTDVSALATKRNYYFSIASRLNVVKPDQVVRRPGGMRLTVVYNTGGEQKVWTKADTGSRAWAGLEGDIVSGADFVLFRRDGVLRLDGRITIRAHDGVLIDAAYNGLVDLFGGRAFGAVGDLPREVVLDALHGRLPYAERADERARATLQGIGEAVTRAARQGRATGAYTSAARTHLEIYAKSKWGPGERTSKILDQFDHLPREQQVEVSELNNVANSVAAALLADNQVRLQDRLTEATLAGARSAAASEGWSRVQAVLGAPSEQNDATAKDLRALYAEIYKGTQVSQDLRTVLDDVTEKRARLIADSLGKAITQRYRDRESDLYEDVINRSGAVREALDFGANDKLEVDVIVPIVFQTASGPWSDAPEEDMNWIGSEYRVNESKFWQYRELVRRSFVAHGTLSLDRGPLGRPPQPSQIDMDVFELTRGAAVP